MIAGRGFDATNTQTSRKVAVINEALAKKYFPNVNPIGKTFVQGYHEPVEEEIVGICADTKYHDLRDEAEPIVYLPYWQRQHGISQATSRAEVANGSRGADGRGAKKPWPVWTRICR